MRLYLTPTNHQRLLDYGYLATGSFHLFDDCPALTRCRQELPKEVEANAGRPPFKYTYWRQVKIAGQSVGGVCLDCLSRAETEKVRTIIQTHMETA